MRGSVGLKLGKRKPTKPIQKAEERMLAIRECFGTVFADKHSDQVCLFCQLSNKLVGRLCVPNTNGNMVLLAAELHRQAFLCVQQDGSLPSAFLNVYVGQTKVQDCTSLSDLSQQRITYKWDYNKHEDYTRVMEMNRCSYRDKTLMCMSRLPDEAIAVAGHARALCVKNPRNGVALSLHGVKRLASLQKVYIRNAEFTIREDDPGFSALLPRNLVELVVTTHSNPKSNILLKGIQNFSCLEHLHLSMNLRYLTDKVGELTNLTHLNLSGNHLRCLPSLKRLTELKVLDVGNNNLLCCNLDIKNTKLTKLDINSCDFDYRVLDDIRACRTLTEVILFGNKRLTSL
jgi:hypothetical protein